LAAFEFETAAFRLVAIEAAVAAAEVAAESSWPYQLQFRRTKSSAGQRLLGNELPVR